MIRGLYTSATAMKMELLSQEVITNNLANIDTPAYKRDFPIRSTFSSLLISRIEQGFSPVNFVGPLGVGGDLERVYTDFSPGPLKFTENKLDLAIEKEGFFVVQTPGGERYTRDGSFRVNSQEELVTKDGFLVEGKQGPVSVKGDFHFTRDGGVVVDGQLINQLRIVIPENSEAFQKIGNNLFGLKEGFRVLEASDFSILEGYLESSNVNVIREMAEMISGFRLYEAAQRSIHFQDETLQRLMGELRV